MGRVCNAAVLKSVAHSCAGGSNLLPPPAVVLFVTGFSIELTCLIDVGQSVD